MFMNIIRTNNNNKSHTYTNKSVRIFSLAILAFSALLALPPMDTAMRFMIVDTLRYNNGSWSFLIPITLICFCVQFWLFNKHRKLCWILPLLSALFITLGEAIWLQVGWARLGSGFFWMVGFPMMLGSSTAILLPALWQASCLVQGVVTGLIVLFFVSGAIFWPRHLSAKIQITPDDRLLYFESREQSEWTQVRDKEGLVTLLSRIKVTPCLSSPSLDDKRGVMLRLNDNYVLVARHSDTSYIYEYVGDLEDFDGRNLKWKVFEFPALYSELLTS